MEAYYSKNNMNMRRLTEGRYCTYWGQTVHDAQLNLSAHFSPIMG
jgi:hypothetical protein